MRSLVYLVVLLLASMFAPHGRMETAQVKLIATTASLEKARALREETHKINECLERYNRVLKEAGVWAEVPPEKTLPIVQEMQDHWQKVEEIYLHFRESP